MSGALPLDHPQALAERVEAALPAGWSSRRDPVRLEFTAARKMLTARTLDELLDAIEGAIEGASA